MAIFTAVTETELATFLAEYGLVHEAFGGIPQGSVNSNYWVEARAKGAEAPPGRTQRIFLRVYEEQDARGALAEAEVLQALAAGGVPTPPPMPNAGGVRVGTLAGKPAALFPWRAGTMRCQASVSTGDLRQLGASLGRVHRAGAGAGLTKSPGRFRRADLEVRLDAIAAAPDDTFRELAPTLRARLAEVEGARHSSLPSGLVHGDLFRDNVLFGEDGTLSALLDFESAFEGTFAFDLAVCLLSWTYGDDFDFALGRALVLGYETVRRFEPAERRAFYEEARFAALRFTITRITDYAMRSGEGPRVMKDYRRFLARFDRLTSLGPVAVERAFFG